jgi:metal-sulfur cluster biosynthetic enzyme
MTNDELICLVTQKLSKVVDPETGVDIIRMKLVQDMTLDDNKVLTYKFRPSSPLCPIAIPLVLEIITTIRGIHEITNQKVTVVDYMQADVLNQMLISLLE